MKKNILLLILAAVLIALFVSCNDEGGLFEDASNRIQSSDLTILSILGADNSNVYFLSLEKGVHTLSISDNTPAVLIDKTDSQTPNFLDAGMSDNKIYVKQYEDSDKNISGGQVAEYDKNGNLTSQTDLILAKLTSNGYGLETGTADVDGNYNVYKGQDYKEKVAKNIIYANGENCILIQKSSSKDLFFINGEEKSFNAAPVSCEDNIVLLNNKTIYDGSNYTTITTKDFTYASNSIGFKVDNDVYFRGEKNFINQNADIITAPWAKPFDASVEITGAVTVDKKVYLSTKHNGIWLVDFTKDTPESTRVL